MLAQDYVIKRRAIWQSGALRLLREAACTRYARQAMPQVIDGTHIELPETTVTWGARMTVASRRFDGQALMDLLYQPEMRQKSVGWGMVAIKALQSADISTHPFTLFSKGYDYARVLKVMLAEKIGESLLSADQKRTLRRLLVDYITTPGKTALIHGDLQASHLLINLSRNSLCFIDLEAMRIGKPVTNFVQLWDAYYHANPALSRKFYQRYMQEYPALVDSQFDADARAELALRNHSHIQQGLREGNQLLVDQARILLANALSGSSFTEICLKEEGHENTESLQ